LDAIPSHLSGFGAQSDKNVSRETFLSSRGPKPYKASYVRGLEVSGIAWKVGTLGGSHDLKGHVELELRALECPIPAERGPSPKSAATPGRKAKGATLAASDQVLSRGASDLSLKASQCRKIRLGGKKVAQFSCPFQEMPNTMPDLCWQLVGW
jgi:hypothetical protein